MIQYKTINLSEGIDIKMSDESKECMYSHYWCFKDIGYKYEPHVCNQCHDLSMVVYDLNDFMILNIKGIDYRCYVFNMSKSDATKLLNNSVLDNKGVKEELLEEFVLRILILVLLINDIKIHLKNLMC